jgi:integrase
MAGARRDEVDLTSGFWRIPPERMKMKGAHLVPLARQVKQRLEALKELTGWGPCLFRRFNGLRCVPASQEPPRIKGQMNGIHIFIHIFMIGLAIFLGVLGFVCANMAGREKKSSE